MNDTHAARVEHLPDAIYTHKRPVYYFCVPLDAWLIVLRPGFLSTGANFAAWAVEDEVRGLSDSQALKGNRHVALPLPTMARTVARGYWRRTASRR